MTHDTKSCTQFVIANSQSGGATDFLNFSTKEGRLLIFTATLQGLQVWPRGFEPQNKSVFQTLNLPLWVDFFLFKKSRYFDQLIFSRSLFLDSTSKIIRNRARLVDEFIMNFIQLHFTYHFICLVSFIWKTCWSCGVKRFTNPKWN